MKEGKCLMAIILLALISCNEVEPESDKTKILTSRTWNKPQILHIPVNLGVYTETSCEQSFRYSADYSYSASDACTGTISGIWSWRNNASQLYLDYKGFVEYNTIVDVLHLSDTLFHTIERSEDEPTDNGNYWEKKYRPK